MLRLIVLASGGLGFELLKSLEKSYTIVAVMTNKGSEKIIEYCREKSWPFFVGNPRKGRATGFIAKLEVDVLLSVNYLFIIEQDIIKLPKQYAINVHGSLLPKYRGRTPHVWAIINGEKQAGITAHLIEMGVDTGDIIGQLSVPIEEEDTGAMMLEKYAVLYPVLIQKVLSDVQEKRINRRVQDVSKATYFGKRTPDSGRINWDWCRERIRNWVRAQAKPYPGAFTYLGTKKITIHKSDFSDLGFHADDPNGKILLAEEDCLVVKTANGCLTLTNIEQEESIITQAGDILS